MKYLGIDLGGTSMKAGVIDEQYHIISKATRPTVVPCPDDNMAEQLELVARDAMQKAGVTLDEIQSIGIGSPGTVNSKDGYVEFANNLYFDHFEVKKLLHERLHKEIFVENDANAAAYGEYKAGALKGAQNALAVTLGTGIGSGIIVDGKIYHGNRFCAGEMGHMVIVKDGWQCTCGRRGCWEAYASASGLIRLTREVMETAPKSSALWELAQGNLEQVNGRTAFDAMRRGDSFGQQIVDTYIERLGCGLANAINILQPDIICIGGGICNEGETLLAPLRAYVQTQMYMNKPVPSTICRAQLGNDAGIIGAALLNE